MAATFCYPAYSYLRSLSLSLCGRLFRRDEIQSHYSFSDFSGIPTRQIKINFAVELSVKHYLRQRKT